MIAPARGRRPGVPAEAPAVSADAGDCPFCEGNEAQTPPETFALGPPGRPPDSPGWRVRVVPNLYPAFLDPAPPAVPEPPFEVRPARGRQEVVVHAPRHALSLAELSDGELRGVAKAWHDRARAARAAGLPYVHAFVNEGRAAGASRSHTHSQLVALPQPAGETATVAATGGCRLCTLLASERDRRVRVLFERDGVACLSAFAARMPYELLVAPLHCEPDGFESERLAAALAATGEALRRLRAVLGAPPPLNAWLANGAEAHGHWRLEVLPRLTVLAGLELGAGLHVNPLPPEQAATELRAAGR